MRGGEDRAKKTKSLTLRLQGDNLQAGDRLAATIGGKPVTGWKSAGKDRVETSVSPSLIARGDNPVKLVLVKQAKTSKAPRVARAVELDVRR